VGKEVAQAFRERDAAWGRFFHPAGSDQWKMNLPGINQHQLMSEGIQEENIFALPYCTCCRKDRFFSVRADGEPSGRQIALIGLRPESSIRNRDEPGLKVLDRASEKRRGGKKRA
jgi:copper oxidase (laccase) domain-containing protein